MKNKLLFLMFCIYGVTFGQAIKEGSNSTNASKIVDPFPPPSVQPNVIAFDYDLAGNQIKRRYIYIASGSYKLNQTNPTLVESDIYEDIEYYPNPVKEELFIKWKVLNNNNVATISIYDINGKQLKQIFVNQDTNFQTVPFGECLNGYYTVLLTYSNGNLKTLKVVK